MDYTNLNPKEFNIEIEKQLNKLIDETFTIYSIPSSMVFKALDPEKYLLIKKHYVKLLTNDVNMTSEQLKKLIQT